MPIHPKEYRLEMFVGKADKGWQCWRGREGRKGGDECDCVHVYTLTRHEKQYCVSVPGDSLCAGLSHGCVHLVSFCMHFTHVTAQQILGQAH